MGWAGGKGMGRDEGKTDRVRMRGRIGMRKGRGKGEDGAILSNPGLPAPKYNVHILLRSEYGKINVCLLDVGCVCCSRCRVDV